MSVYKKDEGRGGCREVCNVDEIGGECGGCERDEKCMQSFDGKTKVNGPLGRHKRVCGIIILKCDLNK
jgi:hypothetical protein